MTSQHTRWNVLAAFAAVYFIWGSTYLAIRFAIETIPPFLMASVRFIIAGTLLYTWTRFRGAPKPTLSQWRSAFIIGSALLLIGNGAVSWAEKVVPSGITALLTTMSPLWFVVIEWLQTRTKPGIEMIIGLILGTVGMIVLVDPAQLVGGDQVNLVGAGTIFFASIAWVWGSLYSRRAELPSSPFLAIAMEMLAGAALLILASVVLGEFSELHLASISLRSTLALLYLTVFGSLIAFTSYVWLLRVASPSLVSTHAYVNPVVAVFLGWLLADEPINGRIFIASVVIVSAVVIITTVKARRASQKSEG
ncbi:MAG: EamA family transporter [Ignavibacteriales bacterium]|nr:EamA family transporter [Ignavibacteriales bacterium]